jgi:Chaperone of endosialidase
MALPTSTTNGATATINGIVYTYSSSKGAWYKQSTASTSVPVTISGTLSVSGNANVGNLGSPTVVNGNSNVTVTANGNITLTAISNSTMVVTSTGANITGTANISGASNIGSTLGVTGNISVINSGTTILGVRPTNFGYSSSYSVVQIGANSGNYTVSLAYDPSVNSNGAFTGDGSEIVTRDGVKFIQPNSTSAWYLNTLVMSGGNVAIGTASATQKLIVSGNTQVTSFGVGTAASGTSGEIRATNAITAFYSDQRLKDIKGPIPDALGKLITLEGVIYTQNATAEKYGYMDYSEQVGVIAQQVQKVLPQIVKPAPFDMDGNNSSVSGENYLTVQYEKLIPLLIESIKQLNAKVNTLETEISELKGR